MIVGYREQINQLTSFLDASTVYGSYDCQANELRLYSQGKLNYTDKLDSLQHGLPQGFKEPDCRSLPKYPCFVAGEISFVPTTTVNPLSISSVAGDNRVNEQTGLAVLHTMYLREHNRIAERLHRINNFWTDEKIYQVLRLKFKLSLTLYAESLTQVSIYTLYLFIFTLYIPCLF